ncbi:signal peptidase I [Streptomyces sp. 4N509B]|uniref:signal peptidase I n=1 Tax=Streptomyces sp. 4N509B TaxID=3457413 RepID=UPI003FCFB53C
MGKRGRPRHERGADEPRPAGHGHTSRHAAPRDHQQPESDEPRTTLRGPGEGRAARRRAAKRIKRRRRLRATREIPILIGVALLIALVLKTFLVQAFVIPSGSMEETIRIDDRVLVDKLTPWFGWEPERGDVVVFNDPGGWLLQDTGAAATEDDDPIGIKQVKGFLTWIGLLPSEDDDLIKRVIGVGGDTVACCDAQGRVTVNGAPVDEPYLFPGNPPSQIEFEVKVPENRIFVMGDHRSNSADSRFHLDDRWHGTVPENLVVGRAVVIAWPFGHWQRLGGEEAFAAVPDPGAGSVNAGRDNREEFSRLPTPAELPLVMGMVSLLRISDRPGRSVRSRCGGCSGRSAVQRGGAGGPSGAAGARGIRREVPWHRRPWRSRGRRLGRGSREPCRCERAEGPVRTGRVVRRGGRLRGRCVRRER